MSKIIFLAYFWTFMCYFFSHAAYYLPLKTLNLFWLSSQNDMHQSHGTFDWWSVCWMMCYELCHESLLHRLWLGSLLTPSADNFKVDSNLSTQLWFQFAEMWNFHTFHRHSLVWCCYIIVLWYIKSENMGCHCHNLNVTPLHRSQWPYWVLISPRAWRT